MNIFTQGDNNFSEGIETLITSLCINNTFEKHHFFIMQTNINDKSKKRILNLENKYNVEITFLKPRGNEFKDPLFVNAPRYNYEGMLRLLMHEYLPQNLDRILYLDADIVVMGNLKDYYYQDFEGKHIVVHATKRDGSGNYLYDIECGLYNIIKIKLPEEEMIFNNGVFLVNLPLWKSDISEKTYFNCLKDNINEIVLIDQDLMNIVFMKKSKKIINRNYNCTFGPTTRFGKNYNNYIKNNVRILHFVEKIKPWNYKKYLSIVLFPYYMRYFGFNHPVQKLWRFLFFYLVKPYQLIYLLTKKGIRKWRSQ